MRKAFIQLHIAVFLAGFTGILGRLIQLNEGWLVWYRLLITVVTFGLILIFQGSLRKISSQDLRKVVAVGTLVALHWVAFYGSIKYSNVSIALVCLSSIGFFTAIFEPLILGRPFDIVEVLLGSLAIIGIYLIFNFNPTYKIGIAAGIASAIFAVLFTIFNKGFVARLPVQTVTFYELGGGWLVLSCLLPFYNHFFPANYIFPNLQDCGWLLILAWLCTVWAFTLQLNALTKLSTFTSNLTYNLEPVYGILLAFLFFHENKDLSKGFYVGLVLIFLAVVLQMLRIMQQHRIQKAVS
jgi:drug/metabolite transporter (DMT)-like permease